MTLEDYTGSSGNGNGRAAPANTNASRSLNDEPLSWHIRTVLAGRVMVAELASKFLVMFGLHGKAKVMGLSGELAVSLMSDAILRAADNNPLGIIAQRTSNREIREAVTQEFDKSLIRFISTHTQFVPDTARQWYMTYQQNKLRELQENLDIFAIRASEGSQRVLTHNKSVSAAAAAEVNALIPKQEMQRIEHRFGGKERPANTPAKDNVHKMGDPYVVTCTKPGCGSLGRQSVQFSDGRYFDTVYHKFYFDDGKEKNLYHRLREISADTAEILRKEYSQYNKSYSTPDFREKMRQIATERWKQRKAEAANKAAQEPESTLSDSMLPASQRTGGEPQQTSQDQPQQIQQTPPTQQPEPAIETTRPPLPQSLEELPPPKYEIKIYHKEMRPFQETAAKPGEPRVIMCPRPGCNQYGIRCVTIAGGRHYEAVRHMDRNIDPSHAFYHLMRRITKEEYDHYFKLLGQRE